MANSFSWLQRDPIGNTFRPGLLKQVNIGDSLYQYCSSKPTDRTDPMGLLECVGKLGVPVQIYQSPGVTSQMGGVCGEATVQIGKIRNAAFIKLIGLCGGAIALVPFAPSEIFCTESYSCTDECKCCHVTYRTRQMDFKQAYFILPTTSSFCWSLWIADYTVGYASEAGRCLDPEDCCISPTFAFDEEIPITVPIFNDQVDPFQDPFND